MLLPGGKNVWMKLPLMVLDIKELILFLKKQEFSGSIHCSFPEFEGLIMIQEGDVVLGLEKTNGRWKTESPTGRLLDRAHVRRDGTINVFHHPQETVEVVVDIFSSPAEAVYHDLSSEFTNFGKFISQLNKGKFGGYLEIRPSDPRLPEVDFLLLAQGEIQAMVSRGFQGRLDMSKPTDQRKFQVYLQQKQTQGIYFSVYSRTPA
jgi:hypothetical protein